MRKIVLVGSENTKRTDYFLKAAQDLKIPVVFESIHNCTPENMKNCVIKIDPFVYRETKIDRMEVMLDDYTELLKRFADCEGQVSGDIKFLNNPLGILEVLDKSFCKKRLIEHGISTTQMILDEIKSIEELKTLMSIGRIRSVFIKPVRSSGAAGVMAYSFIPERNREILYTSSCLDGDNFINTKTLYRLENSDKIHRLLDRVLSMQTIIERWYPKAEFQGKKYDLRVVYQFGKLDFVVARQYNGPITNLHLNNQALSVENLQLPKEKWEEIEVLCKNAMQLFPALSYAGIDVMLEKNSLKPIIIEINGQGDLLYQDIFNENIIYKNQIKHMWELADSEI